MNQKSEVSVIKEVLGGNADCFSQLVNQYYRLCLHYLINAMRIDRETAYDLTQEAFMRALKSLAGFNLERPFKPWLMMICRNLAIDKLKEQNRQTLNLFTDSGKSSDAIESLPEHVDLKNAIDKLSPRQQEIVELHYFADLTCAEIGELINLPVGTVKSELHFARRNMLRILEKSI